MDTNTVTIELGADRALINVFCDVNGESYRGRWSQYLLAKHGIQSANLMSIPNLPGYCFTANHRERSVRVFDPLTEDSRKSRLREVVEAFKARGQNYQPYEPVEMSRLPEKTFDAWLDWMKRCVVAGVARIKDGAFPGGEAVVPDERPMAKTQRQRKPKLVPDDELDEFADE